MSGEFQGEEIKAESSWAGPARILFITLILAAGFVYYYFGPSVEDLQGNSPKASTSREPVTVQVGGATFTIPQNYTQFSKTRRGGVQDTVELFAILPDFEGFTIARQEDFEGNAESSPVVHITLQDLHAPARRFQNETLEQRMTEREKFERIYLPLAVDPKGDSARYGFTRYRLSDTWGGADKELFVYEASDGGIVLYRCLPSVANMPSPWCRRDIMLTERLMLSYRFKRSRLSEWRDIDEKVTNLIASFRQSPAEDGEKSAPNAAAPSNSDEGNPPGGQPAAPPAASFSPPQTGVPEAPRLVPSNAGQPAFPNPAAEPPSAAPKAPRRIDPHAEPDTDDDIVPEDEHGIAPKKKKSKTPDDDTPVDGSSDAPGQ